MEEKQDIVEPMTLDDLGRMMANGFAEFGKDFTEQLSGLEERLFSRIMIVEHKIDAARSDISGLVHDGKKLKGRVEKLEERTFGSIQTA